MIVLDEAPMTYVHAFQTVDRLLRDLTGVNKSFGGNIIVIGGDFRQVIPVILLGSSFLIVSSSIKKHKIWSEFKVLKLTSNMRPLENEKEFSEWLLNVGDGKNDSFINLPSQCLSNMTDPVEELHGDINFSNVTTEQLKSRTIQV